MFDSLTAAGIPLGPLDEPITIYRLGPHAKTHLASWCRTGLDAVAVRPSALRAGSLCSRCGTLPDPLPGYLSEATKLTEWVRNAHEIAETGTLDKNIWIGPKHHAIPLLSSTRRFLVKYRLAATHPALSSWAHNHLLPILERACSTIADAAHAPVFTGPAWPARIAALSELGEFTDHRSATLRVLLPVTPALGTLTGTAPDGSTLTTKGFGAVLIETRRAFIATWLDTGDITAAGTAAGAAGRAALGNAKPTLAAQLPADILIADVAAAAAPGTTLVDAVTQAWQAAAGADLDAVVDALATSVETGAGRGTGTPHLVTFRASLIYAGAKSAWAAEIIRRHTIDVIGNADDATIVCVMGDHLHAALFSVLGVPGVPEDRNDIHLWGPVNAGEGTGLLTTALTLFDQLSVSRPQALDLARAAGA